MMDGWMALAAFVNNYIETQLYYATRTLRET